MALNPEKLKENLSRSVQKVLEAQNQAVIEGMNDLKADFIDRIFLNGQDADNSSIGKYSTKPMYASLNQTSQVNTGGLKPRGKGAQKGQRNQGQFKNGKPRKSMYLPGGYSEFRQVVRRQNQMVDLNLTGSLKGDIRIGTGENKIQLAFTTDEQLAKADGNEKRFGKTIFNASEEELQKLTDRWEREVTDAFFKSFE